jgi:hypothetical protein
MGIWIEKEGVYGPTPFRVKVANTGLIFQRMSEERMPDDEGGAMPPGNSCAGCAGDWDKGVETFPRPKCSEVYESKSKGRAINETNSSIERKERAFALSVESCGDTYS